MRVGVVGVSGYGGGEILRLCAQHPAVQVVYAAGETSAGQRLGSRYMGLGGALADLTIQKFDPHNLPDLDLLFLSLPTGDSRAAAAVLPPDLKVIDVGGDHRFVDGWTYGLTEVTGPAAIADASRVADPGCFPAAALLALAPLVARGLVEPTGIVVDAKTGISGAGRGGGSTFGFADVNEDVAAYNLFKHPHTPEMREAISRMAGGMPASLVFTAHLVPMTRGILATCYAHGPPVHRPGAAGGPRVLRRVGLRARHRRSAAFEVGAGHEPGLRVLRRRPRGRNGHRARRRRQSWEGCGRPGRPEHESDARLP